MAAKAIFFDFWQTLAHTYPPREQRQREALRQLGFEVEEGALQRAFLAAEHYYTQVGIANPPFHRQSREYKHQVYNRYQQIILEGVGLECDYELAERVQQLYLGGGPRELRLFPDVEPTLEDLRARGHRLGLITNFVRDPTEELERLGLSVRFDAIVASVMGAYQKPDPQIFQAGLARLEVRPEEAVHVGDQLLADAQGATAAGLTGVLLDRHDLQPGAHPHRIRTLAELPALLRDGLAQA